MGILERFSGAARGFVAPQAGWLDTTQGGIGRRPELAGVTARPKDLDDHLKRGEYNLTVAQSRKIFSTFGLVRWAIEHTALLAVGNEFKVEYHTDDPEWNEMAENYMREMYYTSADISRRDTLAGHVYLSAVALFRDGDVFVRNVINSNGWPGFQIIPAHRVGTRHGLEKVPEGRYKGNTVEKGIILNKFGAPVAINVLGNTQPEDVIIPLSECIHIVDRSFIEQARGIPAISSGIKSTVSMMSATEYEELGAMLSSAIGMVEHNETGTFSTNDPSAYMRGGLDKVDDLSRPKQYDLWGGLVKVFRAGTGSKLEHIATSKPGPEWESFQNRLAKLVLSGMGLPYEFIWDLGGTPGTGVRLRLGQAQRVIEDLQGVLIHAWGNHMKFATARVMDLHRNSGGARGIPFHPQWYKLGFTLPREITVDYGREAKADQADVQLGLQSHKTLARKRGLNEDQILRDEFEREKKIRELEDEFGFGRPADEGSKDEPDENQ